MHFGLSLSTIHLPVGRECLLGAVVHVSLLNLITLLVRHCLSPSFPKAEPACPDILQKNIIKTLLTACRIVGEEEGKSWLLLTGVSPQTKAANITCQKLHTQMVIDKAPSLPCQVPQKASFPVKLETCMGPEGAWTSWCSPRKAHLYLLHFLTWPECFIASLMLPFHTHRDNLSCCSQLQGCWRGDFDDWSNKTELIKLMLFSLTVPLIISDQQTTGRLQVHEGEINRKQLIFLPI